MYTYITVLVILGLQLKRVLFQLISKATFQIGSICGKCSAFQQIYVLL